MDLFACCPPQVSAYKRAFRSQQQMLKAEMLHQQAKLLQQEDNLQANSPPPTPHPRAMPAPSPPVAMKFMSGDVASGGGLPMTAPPLRSHRAPPLPTGRAGVRPIVRRNGAGESAPPNRSRGLAVRQSRRDVGGAGTTNQKTVKSSTAGLRVKAAAKTGKTEKKQRFKAITNTVELDLSALSTLLYLSKLFPTLKTYLPYSCSRYNARTSDQTPFSNTDAGYLPLSARFENNKSKNNGPDSCTTTKNNNNSREQTIQFKCGKRERAPQREDQREGSERSGS